MVHDASSFNSSSKSADLYIDGGVQKHHARHRPCSKSAALGRECTPKASLLSLLAPALSCQRGVGCAAVAFPASIDGSSFQQMAYWHLGVCWRSWRQTNLGYQLRFVAPYRKNAAEWWACRYRSAAMMHRPNSDWILWLAFADPDVSKTLLERRTIAVIWRWCLKWALGKKAM